jgi:hypothetical protein
MNKIKTILYIIGIDLLIILFALTLATNLIELLQPIYKALANMILGMIVYFICKDITKILIKEAKEENKK